MARKAMPPVFSIRIDFANGLRLGPGKVRLLEEIEAQGSISAAGRAMDMSYKRAWDLVEELDRIFGAPVVTSKAGGAKGGGAALTALGKKIVILYRQAEKQANVAAKPALRALSKARSGKQK